MATTGYGIINQSGKDGKAVFECVKYGIIKTEPGMEIPQRLKIIHNDLSKIIALHRPEALVMENIFFFRNVKTVIPVSQAQGVILLAAATKKLPVYRFTPLEIKMTITGFGRAEKKDIQNEIKRILGLEEIPKPDDAADALSVAATYLIRRMKD